MSDDEDTAAYPDISDSEGAVFALKRLCSAGALMLTWCLQMHARMRFQLLSAKMPAPRTTQLPRGQMRSLTLRSSENEGMRTSLPCLAEGWYLSAACHVKHAFAQTRVVTVAAWTPSASLCCQSFTKSQSRIRYASGSLSSHHTQQQLAFLR